MLVVFVLEAVEVFVFDGALVLLVFVFVVVVVVVVFVVLLALAGAVDEQAALRPSNPITRTARSILFFIYVSVPIPFYSDVVPSKGLATIWRRLTGAS